jgi:two-component system response regulator AtoC
MLAIVGSAHQNTGGLAMLEIPSRTSLAALTEASNAIVPTLAMGFARQLDDGRVSIFYSHPYGIIDYVLAPADVPDALAPARDGVRQAGAEVIRANTDQPTAWQFSIAGVRRVISFSLPTTNRATRCWIGLRDDAGPTDEQVRALEQVAMRAGAALVPGHDAGGQSAEELRRLEIVAGLLPTLLTVLDIREVFDRVSSISQAAVPHDMLTLGLFNDDLSQLTLYARTGQGSDTGRTFPQPYPTAVVQSFAFDVIDDRSEFPLERERPPTTLGMRSSLRLPLEVKGRTIGGIGFHARERGAYGLDDVAVGRRLADHVAVAVFHHQLAEEGRRSAALQERTRNLDLLDGLMHTITGVLDVRSVFDRIFEVSQGALPHDAMSIAVPSADGTRVTLYATTGALRDLPVPWDQPLADTSLVQREWDSVVIDDLPADPVYAALPSVKVGMRSLVVIPVRLEEQLRAWVNFWSATPARFTQADVPLARRIAAHITLTLSHQRLAEQALLNEELRARATNLELLDELLAALIDSGDLGDVFERISAIAGKVLAHDAVALLVRTPDGHHHHAYASHGFPAAAPAVTDVPQELLDNPDWEHDLEDDVAVLDARYAGLAAMGFRSLLRVPIRLEGRFAGALVFVSKKVAAFKPADVLVARRIADRLAVTLARERIVEASKRADEATARAAKLEARVRALTEELDVRTGYRRVVGDSKQWRQVLTQAAQVASTDTTVLLLGESGTGKEVVARFLHRGSSRDSGPFVALNCAALPEQLLEAELFGYERGAYTGATQSKPGQLEQAAGGTLFLDEVGEMSLPAQAKFLRVLQEREFQRLGGTRVLRTDARIVAATNRDLRRAITHGQFREDLYYRLNVFAINLPALRDRRDDVLPLSEAFLNEIGRGLGRPPGGISREARQMLVEYHWPGNVRELRNILERAAILCDGGLITPDYLALTAVPPAPLAPLPPPPITAAATVAAAASPAQPSSAKDLLDMERAMIEQALQSARFNKSKAAKALGMTRHQLYLRLQKYGLE